MVMRLSDTCTTGWLEWDHGELWLTRDRLVRLPSEELTRQAKERSRGRGRAGAKSELRRAQAQPVELQSIADGTWRARIDDTPDATVVELASVERYRFKPGRITSRLDLYTPGSHHVFLWLPHDLVAAPLTRALTDASAHRAAFADQ